MLDTSVLIDVAKGGRSPESRRAQGELLTRLRAGDTLFTSRLNEAEFRIGSFRSTDPARETAKIDAVLAATVILDFDALAARIFARIKAAVLSIGKFPGDMDVLIAAVALANGEPLLTRNPRHFADIPGLVVESY
jgi:predicted nucleic acid-binding protein